MTLSCGFIGEPLPDITWSRDGRPIGQEGHVVTTGNRSELTVQEVTRERAGVYRCSASNSVGTSSLQFTVQGKPHPPHDMSIAVTTVCTQFSQTQ